MRGSLDQCSVLSLQELVFGICRGGYLDKGVSGKAPVYQHLFDEEKNCADDMASYEEEDNDDGPGSDGLRAPT